MKFPVAALHRFLFCLSALFFVGYNSYAMAENKPMQFVRVTTLEELTDEAWYLIGTKDPKTGNFYLMRAEIYGSSKLKAVRVATPVDGEPINASNTLHFWRFNIKRNETSLQISISDAEGQNVAANNAAAADLSFDSSKPTEWIVTTADNNCFHFQHPSSQRYISLSITTLSYFGNYVDELKDLCIYKSVDDFSEVQGKQTLPIENATYTIKSNGYVSASTLTPVLFSSYELYNGGVAYSMDLCRLKANVTEDSGTFNMANEETGAYLDYGINWSDVPATWTIVNGHIATTENPARFLVYDKGAYAVYTSEEIKKSTLTTEAIFEEMGEKPTSELSDNGVLTLRGSWHNSALAKLELSTVRAIDASNIVLPRHPLDFGADLGPNVPIYIPAEQADCIPDGWPFVAVKSGNSYTLLRSATLQDHSALYLPFSIETTSTKSLSYVRDAYVDGKWETLYLPFSSNIPTGFEAYELESVSGGAINIKRVTTIAACTPTLMRSTSTGGGNKPVTFKAAGGSVTTESKARGVFRGTFSPLVFLSASDKTYLLESTGEAFILVDDGSRLSPYRCFIRTESSQGIRFMINTGEMTGTQLPVTSDAPVCIRDLSGRRLKDVPHGGIYISNHKKILSTK